MAASSGGRDSGRQRPGTEPSQAVLVTDDMGYSANYFRGGVPPELDQTSVISWVSSTKSHHPYITTAKTDGLRRICQCRQETVPRAFYIKRSLYPKPLKKWKTMCQWVGGIFKQLKKDPPPHPRGFHETFRAALSYQITRAFNEAERRKFAFTGPEDPRFLALMGETIEFTTVQIPVPWPEDLTSFAQEFYGHQNMLQTHMAAVGEDWTAALETIPPFVREPKKWPPALPATPGPQGPDVMPDQGDHYDSDTEEEELRTPSEDGSVRSNLSADAPVFGPKTPPVGYVTDTSTPAGVRPVPQQRPPGETTQAEGAGPDPAQMNEPQAGPSGEGAGVKVVEGPVLPVSTDQAGEAAKNVAAWVGKLPQPPPAARSVASEPARRDVRTQTPPKMEKRAGIKYMSARQRRLLPKILPFTEPVSPERELRNPPVEEEPEYDQVFYDEGPTATEEFAAVARAVKPTPDTTPCNHDLFMKAQMDKRLYEPHLYCRHVRRALATTILRHPNDWRINSETCHALGAAFDYGLLPGSLTTDDVKDLQHVSYQDNKPSMLLQDRYNVEVKNRFSALFVEDMDTIDASIYDDVNLVSGHARAAQVQGRGKPKTAEPESAAMARRRKREAEQRASREALQTTAKTREQRKRDGQNALKRIAKRLSRQDYDDVSLAKTVLINNVSPSVRRLIEERHHWCRVPLEAFSKGKWCWLAACVMNDVSKEVAVTGLFRFVPVLGDLLGATGSNCWIRDLCADGDVEDNPGPVGVVNAPMDGVDMKSGVDYWPWVKSEGDKAEDPLLPAFEYATQVAVTPDSRPDDVNLAVLAKGSWYRAKPSRIQRATVDTWSTTLYQTTLSGPPRQLSAAVLAPLDADVTLHVDSVPHLRMPTPPAPPPLDQAQAQAAAAAPEQAGREEGEIQDGQNDQQDGQVVDPQGGQGGQRPVEGADAVPGEAPPPPPDLRQQHIHPENPDVILACLTADGAVVKITSSRGRGVALPLRGTGAMPYLTHLRGHNLVIGRLRNGQAHGSLRYATRVPITAVARGDEPLRVYLGSDAVDHDDAEFLREMKTPESPWCIQANGDKVFLIGEWYDAYGKGGGASIVCRSWGPPKFSFCSRTGRTGGTKVKVTGTKTDEEPQSETRPIIIPRVELTSYGFDKTTAERLALDKKPKPTTCEANAFKLGLMYDWAMYGSSDVMSRHIFTGQAQVHEPDVHIMRSGGVKRLFNNSGIPPEDCGGMVMPVFPFFENWNRGSIRFYATAQAVPLGEAFLVLPSTFDGQESFREAAVFLLTFLPWPWGNMSLKLRTKRDSLGTQPQDQVYTWHGATTQVPGFTDLNIVLHQLNVGEVVGAKPHDVALATCPRMGPAPVECWPANAPIPVNYRTGQNFYVAASSFAASWACGFDYHDMQSVLSKIASANLFDNVERWVFEGPCIARCHAGIMTTRRAKLDADALVEMDPAQLPLPIFDTVPQRMDDPVPLRYRCWTAAGYRQPHVPPGVNWGNVRLAADGCVVLPNIKTLTAIYAGFYEFESKFAIPSMGIGNPLLAAAQFIACERMFVAWHMWHSMIGLNTRTLDYSSRSEKPGRGEVDYFVSVFGFGTSDVPPIGNLLRLALERVLGGKLLCSVTNECILQRLYPQYNWEPQVVALEDGGVSLESVCPTPLIDIYIYKYLGEVPKSWQPFRVSYTQVTNSDIYNLDPEVAVYCPVGMAGTFIWTKDKRAHDVNYRDIMRVRDHSFWLSRLVHAFDEYALRDFGTANLAPKAPAPGKAPTNLIRGNDDWVGRPRNLFTAEEPYPFFSTTWMSWMDGEHHKIWVLMQPMEDTSRWWAVMNGPTGVASSGFTFTYTPQPAIEMPLMLSNRDLWLDDLKASSGNVAGAGPSGGKQDDPSDDNSKESS
nr:MAG: structural protein [Totiviridae sp.]